MNNFKLFLFIFVMISFVSFGYSNGYIVVVSEQKTNIKKEAVVKKNTKTKKINIVDLKKNNKNNKRNTQIEKKQEIKHKAEKEKFASIDSYKISVIGRSIENAISVGKYDFVNENINSQNFNARRYEFDKKEIFLIKFNAKEIDSDDALFFMNKMGFRPATLMELLSLGEKYPNIQKEKIIIALGSVCLNEFGGRMVPILWGDKNGRSLNICLYSFLWVKNATFACVRK